MACTTRHLKIGVEIHARINAANKLFSRASARNFDTNGRPPMPNSQVAHLDAAFPGAMPVLNDECVEKTILTGLALGGSIQEWSYFERKHYFYCGKLTFDSVYSMRI